MTEDDNTPRPAAPGSRASDAVAAKAPSVPVKLAIELGPLIVFFAAFQWGGLMVATAAFMVAMVAAMGTSWLMTRHVAPMLWVSFVIVMVMGSLTLYFADETFVKMKPTLVNLIFSTVLIVGLVTGRPLLKTVLASGLPPMAEQGWVVMTRNWALFFAAMAVLNELVWRSQTTDVWVNFKTFGYLPITLVFALLQTPVIARYQLDDDSRD